MADRLTSVNARARAPRRRALLPLVIAALAVGTATPPLAAQGTRLFTEDAAPVPKGALRLRVIPGWDRADQRFTADGDAEPLGAVRTSKAFGPMQAPALGPIESALRTLTGNPDFALSLGAAKTTASTRTVVMPLMMEYGLTRRLSFGVNVPIVRWRAQVAMTLDRSLGATVGVGSAVQVQQAAALRQQLDASVSTLEARLAQCQSTPTAPNCDAINANRAGAEATLALVSGYRNAVNTVFGATKSAPFLPFPGSAAAQAITAQLAAVNAQYRGYVGSDAVTAAMPFAAGAAGLADFQAFQLDPTNPFAPDTIGVVRGIGLGDVEVGARFVVLDRWLPRRATQFGDTVPAPALGWRLSAGALARLGTGTPPGGRQFLDPGTGDGQTDIEGSALLDVRVGRRFGGTAVGRYTAQTGSVEATGPVYLDDGGVLVAPAGSSRTLGNIMSLELSPRGFINEALSVDGHYGFEHRGADTYTLAAPDSTSLANWVGSASSGSYTLQRAGVGFTYSTLRAWERGMVRWPIELSWTHIETITGDSRLLPKTARDFISLRIYYQLIGRR